MSELVGGVSHWTFRWIRHTMWLGVSCLMHELGVTLLHAARRFQRSALNFWNAVLHTARRSEPDRNRIATGSEPAWEPLLPLDPSLHAARRLLFDA